MSPSGAILLPNRSLFFLGKLSHCTVSPATMTGVWSGRQACVLLLASLTVVEATRKYRVGAFYYGPWHRDPTNEILHGANWTEWRLVSAAQPRFAGHMQVRRSLPIHSPGSSSIFSHVGPQPVCHIPLVTTSAKRPPVGVRGRQRPNRDGEEDRRCRRQRRGPFPV